MAGIHTEKQAQEVYSRLMFLKANLLADLAGTDAKIDYLVANKLPFDSFDSQEFDRTTTWRAHIQQQLDEIELELRQLISTFGYCLKQL